MMIERLKGQLVASLPTGVIIDVGGVGYGVDMPLSALCALPAVGEQISVWTYTLVREDAIRLYGFMRYAERLAFETLLSLNGVGPKVAMAILSTLTLAQVQNAVLSHQASVFESVPGIGARLSERILVELKPKLAKLQAAMRVGGATAATGGAATTASDLFAVIGDGEAKTEAIFEDVKSALENLGFGDKNVVAALKKLRLDTAIEDFQTLMRRALVELTGGGPRVEAAITGMQNAKSPTLFD